MMTKHSAAGTAEVWEDSNGTIGVKVKGNWVCSCGHKIIPHRMFDAELIADALHVFYTTGLKPSQLLEKLRENDPEPV